MVLRRGGHAVDVLRYPGEVVSELDKVLKLLALTETDNEHEARTAAILVCRFLRQGLADHTIELREPGSAALDTACDILDRIPRGRGGPWVDMAIPDYRRGVPTADEVNEANRRHIENAKKRREGT